MTTGREPRILVVDDEIHIRQLIGEVLKRNNYLVDKAANGKEALTLFQKTHHDVVITDIRMPEMDGLELLKHVKQESPFTEVIVITGHASRESAVKALDLGAYTYFVKPFESLDIIPLLTLKTLQHQNLLRENERLIEMLRKYLSEKQQELVTFEEIAEGLSRLENHSELLDLLIRRVLRELRAAGVWLWVLKDGKLVPQHQMGRPDFTDQTRHAIALGSGVIGTAASTGTIQRQDDLTQCDEDGVIAAARDAGLVSLYAVPLLVDDEPAGVLGAFFTSDDVIGLKHVDGMRSFARKMSLVIKMINLYSELLRKNEQIRKAQDLLLQTERLGAQGQLASGIAHELGGPLGVIETTTQYLLESDPDMEEIQECLEVIQERVEEMGSFVIDMLELNRNRAISFQTVNIHSQIDKILRFLKQKIRNQKIEVVRSYSEKVSRVEIDVSKFNQVLINLFLNALDAMAPQGQGKLRIETMDGPEPREISLIIDDSGPGIPPEVREKIFTPFFSRKTNGTGLGLAITQQIINDHNGVVFAGVGSGGQGARFTIKLPVSRFTEADNRHRR